MAERVGFEPTDAFTSPVFKTGTINRTRTPLHILIISNCSIASIANSTMPVKTYHKLIILHFKISDTESTKKTKNVQYRGKLTLYNEVNNKRGELYEFEATCTERNL